MSISNHVNKMDRYFYQIGDEVTHIIEPDLKGIIVGQLTMDEKSLTPKDELDVNNQWYHVNWVEVPDGVQPFIGLEQLESLCPAYVTKILNR